VPAALVVGRGPELYLLLPGGGRALRVPPAPGENGARRPAADRDPAHLPLDLLRAIEALPGEAEIAAGSAALVEAIGRRTHRAVRATFPLELRSARRAFPPWDPRTERAYLLEIAHVELERALRSPEEVLVTLAREEERVERVVGREERAAESMLTPAGTPLVEYAAKAKELRAGLAQHHAELLRRVEEAAAELVPNLSLVVGPRTAARLVAVAGGVAPLARVSGARIQLLGSRRRPSPTRGPRFGVLYRAERMEDVPPARRAAYARSLAALAAIAVRADATTRRLLGNELRSRRDRRVAELARRRS
jgi:hypothetical protein